MMTTRHCNQNLSQSKVKMWVDGVLTADASPKRRFSMFVYEIILFYFFLNKREKTQQRDERRS